MQYEVTVIGGCLKFRHDVVPEVLLIYEVRALGN